MTAKKTTKVDEAKTDLGEARGDGNLNKNTRIRLKIGRTQIYESLERVWEIKVGLTFLKLKFYSQNQKRGLYISIYRKLDPKQVKERKKD